MKNWKIIVKVPDDLKADIDAFRDADDLIRWFNLTGQPQNHPLFQKYSAQILLILQYSTGRDVPTRRDCGQSQIPKRNLLRFAAATPAKGSGLVTPCSLQTVKGSRG
jgi:hypothetical protein